MCDCDEPQAIRHTTCKARKSHICVECRVPIAPGQHYELVSGIWDKAPTSFATCLSCAAIHDWFANASECRCGAPFGQLILRLDEHARYQGADLWAASGGEPAVIGRAAGLLLAFRLAQADRIEERRRARRALRVALQRHGAIAFMRSYPGLEKR